MSVTTSVRPALRRPMLSVRTGDAGGRTVATTVSGGEFLRTQVNHHLMILVHGYNNSFDAAEKSYEKFVRLLSEEFRRHPFDIDVMAEFYWPGDPAVDLGLLSLPMHYPFALANARVAAKRLAELLLNLPRPRTDASSLTVSLVGHSMGCRLILELLRAMPAGERPRLSGVGLMAAAVPVELVRAEAELDVESELNQRLLKFFSPNDRVLRFLFPLGQWWSSLRHVDGVPIERAYYSEAVGFDGHPASFAVACPRRNNGHGTYWGDKQVVQTMLNAIDPTFPIPREAWGVGSYSFEANQIKRYRLKRGRQL